MLIALSKDRRHCLLYVKKRVHLNIDINSDFINFENFVQIDGTVNGNVNISVIDGLGNDQGALMLEGNIDSFAIGGQELFIDDVCLEE